MKWRETTFLVHLINAGVLGAIMLVAPGRLLSLVGWAPIDPIMSRLLGAVTVALAWTSLQGWRIIAGADGAALGTEEEAKVGLLVQMEAMYTLLASVGLLRHLLYGRWPWYAWLLFADYALFAIAWIVCAIPQRRSS